MPEENSAPSLRETLTSAVESASNETPVSTPETSVSTTTKGSAPPTSPESSTQGSETGASPYLEEKVKSHAEQQPETAKDAAQKSGEVSKREPAGGRIDRPPQSWKGEAREAWGSLPLPVRQEIYKRERDINNQLQQYAGLRSFTEEYARAIQPYLPRMQHLRANPIQHTQRLFETERVLAQGSKNERAAMLASIIKDYDIDLPTLDGVLAGRISQDNQPSNVIRSEIQQALGPVYQFMGQMQQTQHVQEQQEQERADNMVVQMSQDPQFPYMEELRYDMADLIDLYSKRGIALTLQQAYSRAAAGHPEISKLINAGQIQDQTDRAKAASVSVGGAPMRTPASAPDVSDLRSAINNAIAVNSRR